jgi:hypothetical protein
MGPTPAMPSSGVGGSNRPSPELILVTGARPAHLHVRPARPSDLPALEAMVERSSADTLYRRFHGAVGSGAKR